jgi:PadR family transcriptional regulator, regulatory protein PadR
VVAALIPLGKQALPLRPGVGGSSRRPQPARRSPAADALGAATVAVANGGRSVLGTSCSQPTEALALDYPKISSYFWAMPRRKPGTLLPLETEILEVALSLRRAGHATFHGFGLAQTMRERTGSRSLTAHGTLYKALGRLEEFGLLASRWEDSAAAVEGRPRRRLYELTGAGAQAAELALADKAVARRPRIASEPA